jgi:hypothetical protein
MESFWWGTGVYQKVHASKMFRRRVKTDFDRFVAKKQLRDAVNGTFEEEVKEGYRFLKIGDVVQPTDEVKRISLGQVEFVWMTFGCAPFELKLEECDDDGFCRDFRRKIE